MAKKMMPPQSLRSEGMFGLILPAMSRHKSAVAYAGFMAWCIVFYPKHEGIQLERAYRMALKGRYRRALALVRRLCQYANTSAHSYAMQHLLLIKLGRRDDAMRAIERAIAIDPACAEFHTYRGRLLLEDSHEKEAEQAFRDALGVDSHDAYARSHLAYVLARSGRLEEAPWLEKHMNVVNIEDCDAFFTRAYAHIKVCALRVTANRLQRLIPHHPRVKTLPGLLKSIRDEIDMQKKRMS